MATHAGGASCVIGSSVSSLNAPSTTHTGNNGALIAVIVTYAAIGDEARTPTSVTRTGGVITFTEAVALRRAENVTGAIFPNRKIFVFYALLPGAYSGDVRTDEVIFDGVCGFASMDVHEVQNACQGAPVNLGYTNGANTFGSIGMELVLVNTDVNSVICGSSFLLRTSSGGNGIEGYSVVNMTGVIGSTVSTWDGKHFNYSPSQATPSANITISSSKWREKVTGTNIRCDYMFVLVEVQDVDWYPTHGEVINIGCGYAGQATSQVANLGHLEGQKVAILANGEVIDRQVVKNGAIELNGNYSVVYAGLPYEADLETLKIEVPWKEGTVQSRKVKVNNVIFRIQNSRGGYIGPNKNDLYEAFTHDAIVQSSGQNLELLNMFTCDVRQPLGAGYSQEGNVFYRQVDPLPITIGAIIPEVSVGGQSR